MRKLTGAVLCLAALLTATSCSNGTVPLEYSFDDPQGTRYLWQIDSLTTINSSTNQRSTRVRMEVEILEKLLEEKTEDGDRLLAITLTPKDLNQDDEEMELPEPITVIYRLGEEGQLGEPVDNDLEPAAASALELGTLLTRSRIPLPEGPVGIGGTWEAPLLVEGQTGSFDLEGEGTLTGFALEKRRRLAEIEIERSGIVTGFEQLAGVLVELRGRSTSDTVSKLDIDNGVLLSSHSEFVTNFDMSRLDSGELAGTLDVELTSRLELQPE